MNLKNRFNITKILSALLAGLLLTSCAGPLPDGLYSRETAPQQTTASYESLQADSLRIQNEFDQLLEDTFKENIILSSLSLHYTLADPQKYGINNPPITFGDYTLDSMREQEQESQELLDKLNGINESQLSDSQKLSYRILKSYLNTELSSQGMELYMEPLMPEIGIHSQLPILLAEYQFYNRNDIDDYLELLAQIDVYYQQILDFEKMKSAAGLFMSDTLANQVIDNCDGYLLAADHNFMIETFENRITSVEGLTPEEIADYIQKNKTVFEEHFLPAYQNLVSVIGDLKGTGMNEKGMCFLPKGKQYYEYLLQYSTGTSYETVDRLKKAIQKRMNLDLTQISTIAGEHPDTTALLDSYSFKETEPERILDDLKNQVQKDFPALPSCNYTVKQVPAALEQNLSPAFYLTPPIDRFEDNVIYINNNERFKNSDLYITLAHEGYPGHLYQNVYFSSSNTCNLRQILSFSGYSEGWATYVEHYAYGLDNGLDPNLGQMLALNSSVILGLHCIIDLNVNYYGWGKDEVREYLKNYFDVEGSSIVEDLYQAVIGKPTNYLEYYVGYLEFTDMKEQTAQQLKKNFDLKTFHKFILDLGPAPFEIIQSYHKAWLLTQ